MSRIEHTPECASLDPNFTNKYPACTCNALARANKEIQRLERAFVSFQKDCTATHEADNGEIGRLRHYIIALEGACTDAGIDIMALTGTEAGG